MTTPYKRLLALVVLCGPTFSLAQEAAPAAATASQDEVVILDPFTVKTGATEGFKTEDASSATRIAVDLRDAPLSISVMPNEVLQDLMAVDIKQGFYYGPGITGGGVNREAYSADGIYRGIVENSIFTDGTPLLGTRRFDEPFEIERIEIIRGPSGVTFGSGFFGGLANRVSKQPKFTAQGHLRVRLDDNSLFKTAVDYTGPLNDSVAYRVIASYTDGKLSDKLYDDFDQHFIRTALTWRLGRNTTLTANLKYSQFNSVMNLMGDFLEGASIDTLYKFDTEAYSPARDLYTVDKSDFQSWISLTHSVGDWLSLRTVAAYTHYDENTTFAVPTPGGAYFNDQGQSIPRPDGVLNVVFDWLDAIDIVGGAEQDVLFKYDIAGTKNNTLATVRVTGLSNGIDENRRRMVFVPFRYKNGAIGLPDNVNPFVTTPKDTVLPLTWNDQNREPAVSLSLQHFISLFNDRLHLTGGITRDEQKGSEKVTSGTAVSVQPLDFKADLVRYGASVRATDWLTLYGQYNEGFRPPSPRVDRINGTVFGPQTAKSKEVGFRTFWFNNKITFEGAFYKMDLAGIIQPYPDSATQGSFQRGGDISKGWELILQGEITPNWSIMASVNHNDYRQQNGERVRLSVGDYGNLYTKYRFNDGALKGFAVGLGTWWKLDYLDGYYTDAGGVKRERNFPNAQVFDLILEYDYKPFTFGVTVSNLFDEFYYTSNSSNIFFRGSKRHVSLTVDYRF